MPLSSESRDYYRKNRQPFQEGGPRVEKLAREVFDLYCDGTNLTDVMSTLNISPETIDSFSLTRDFADPYPTMLRGGLHGMQGIGTSLGGVYVYFPSKATERSNIEAGRVGELQDHDNGLVRVTYNNEGAFQQAHVHWTPTLGIRQYYEMLFPEAGDDQERMEYIGAEDLVHAVDIPTAIGVDHDNKRHLEGFIQAMTAIPELLLPPSDFPAFRMYIRSKNLYLTYLEHLHLPIDTDQQLYRDLDSAGKRILRKHEQALDVFRTYSSSLGLWSKIEESGR